MFSTQYMHVAGAIAKLIGCLEIRIPHGLDDQFNLLSHIPEDQRPVVFVGPMEHHSNEVMWRETIATVVAIDEDEFGFPSVGLLRSELERFADRPCCLTILRCKFRPRLQWAGGCCAIDCLQASCATSSLQGG